MIELLWRITVGSWITAGAIILLRLLFRKHLSAKSKYLLWLLLLVRLMLPVLPESPLSVMNLANTSAPVIAAAPISRQSAQNPAAEHEMTSAITAAPTSQRPTSRQIVFALWIAGVLVCGSAYGIMTIQTARRLRSMEPIRSVGVQNRYEAIRQQLGIRRTITLRYGDRAMIGGLLRPTLILPRELTGQRLKAAITHELMHYRSGDLWIAAWWRVLCCLYWFNPVVWLCFFWARRDCEKACDQRVLSCESISPAVYAALLYEEATMRPKMHVGTTAFGGGGLKSRIYGISVYRKPKITMTVLAVVLCLLISACTMTGSQTASTNAEQNGSGVEALNGGQATQSIFLHALCQHMEGWTFQPENHDYFWQVMSYFAATQSADSDSEYIELTPEQVMEMAQIAFPELETIKAGLLPGIPGYILGDGEVPTVELNHGNYRFVRRNISYSMETKQLSAEDDAYQLLVTLNDAQGNSIGQWDVSLDSTGAIHSMKEDVKRDWSGFPLIHLG